MALQWLPLRHTSSTKISQTDVLRKVYIEGKNLKTNFDFLAIRFAIGPTFDRLKHYLLSDQSTTSMSHKSTTSIDQNFVSNANLVSAFFKNAVSLGERPLLFHKKKGENGPEQRGMRSRIQ